MRVSVVVVSFNTKEKLRHCLSCIESEHEVIVVDNASADGSADMVATEFPKVKLIRNAANVGFGGANNQGAAIAGGDLLLYLNSDCYAAPGAISILAAAFGDGVVAAGGKLLNPDGSLQESVAARLTLWMVFIEQTFLERVLRPMGLGYWRTGRATEVDQVMGACLMVRRGLESFDERFFLYCEDTDLCRRLSRHGRILYVPEAECTHELGSSSKANPWLGVARYNLGKELYFEIHHGKAARLVCWALDRFGALLRLLMWLPLALLRPQKAALFWKVLTVPSAQLAPKNHARP